LRKVCGLLRLKNVCAGHLLGIKDHINLQDMQVGCVKIMPPHDDTFAVNEEITSVRCHHPHHRLPLVTVYVKLPVFGDVDFRHPQLGECLHPLFELRQGYISDLLAGNPDACGSQCIHDVIVGNELVL